MPVQSTLQNVLTNHKRRETRNNAVNRSDVSIELRFAQSHVLVARLPHPLTRLDARLCTRDWCARFSARDLSTRFPMVDLFGDSNRSHSHDNDMENGSMIHRDRCYMMSRLRTFGRFITMDLVRCRDGKRRGDSYTGCVHDSRWKSIAGSRRVSRSANYDGTRSGRDAFR